MRNAISRLLAIAAVCLAVPAQAMMFAAEWVGDLSDEWLDG